MIDFSILQYRIEPMHMHDLDEVVRIENVSFTAPWSRNAFEYELHYNQIAHYIVARSQPRGVLTLPGDGKSSRPFWVRWLEGNAAASEPVAGYGGFWKMVDEAHISTIAVAPELRGRGIGELILIALIEASQQANANLVTLEVRKSNETAQALYRKHSFEIVGERKHYYSDNGEDAWIMTTPEISTAAFNARLNELRVALLARLSA